MPQAAPYGSWKSPIASDLIAAGAMRLGDLQVDGADVYWSESRPTEGGRSVIVRLAPGHGPEDITPAPFNARSRVHEYGGGAFAVCDGNVYFTNFMDQRIYRVRQEGEPEPLTSDGPRRYADAVLDHPHRRLICVCEDHGAGGREPENTLVGIDLQSGRRDILAAGEDFYSNPRLSQDGRMLAWISWRHPDMPWDSAELWAADCSASGLTNPRKVAGGPGESAMQPEWGPDGGLYFIAEITGWWNLYRWRDGRVEPLYRMEAEFGEPQWVFGLQRFALLADGDIACIYGQNGIERLAILETAPGRLTPLDVRPDGKGAAPFTGFSTLRAAGHSLVFKAASPTESTAIIRLDLRTRTAETLRRSSELNVDPAYLSAPEAIEFPTEEGKTAFGFYYPPQNPDFTPPPGEKPPLLVMSHGGPTSASPATLSYTIQYWTSRGMGVLDVNYGGSTGCGREYRERLDGRWGIVDVDDCVNGALYLARRGDADRARLAIRGGSAGGYTTLCALTFRDTFQAGASHYGISDLTALAEDTHKFESRYLERLVGPYPERADLYRERSPIHFVDRLSCPLIVFQGLEDRVVPPNQAEMMVAAVRRRGVAVAYVAFAGEQHGFRKAENIKRSLDAELYFYSRIFGFPLSEPIEAVEIENLPTNGR